MSRSGSFEKSQVCLGASCVNQLMWQAEILYTDPRTGEARVILTEQIPGCENPDREPV